MVSKKPGTKQIESKRHKMRDRWKAIDEEGQTVMDIRRYSWRPKLNAEPCHRCPSVKSHNEQRAKRGEAIFRCEKYLNFFFELTIDEAESEVYS